MGQQQLLLIVLVLIMVGLSIVVGMQLYDQSIRDSAIDNLTKDLVHLGSLAMNYYRTPSELGGGGQSFKASSTGGTSVWDVPAQLDSLDDRTYTITAITDNSMEIMGKSENISTGFNNNDGVQVYVELDKNGVTNFRIEN